jgi:hypothetical protein
MYAALVNMVEEGFVHAEEARRMVIPTAGRSRSDLVARFTESGCFGGLSIEELSPDCTRTAACPHFSFTTTLISIFLLSCVFLNELHDMLPDFVARARTLNLAITKRHKMGKTLTEEVSDFFWVFSRNIDTHLAHGLYRVGADFRRLVLTRASYLERSPAKSRKNGSAICVRQRFSPQRNSTFILLI